MLSSYNASGIDFVSYGVSQRFRDIIIYIYIGRARENDESGEKIISF